MDRRSIKFDWNRARAFLVTAEEGSLSAAARALNMTQPTLSRQVSALEVELGVVLFERINQGLSLTPAGLELLSHVKVMGNAANALSLSSLGQSQIIAGKVSISASEPYAAFILPPVLLELREIAPNIEVEIIASNQPSDLKRREADIAIRNFRPTELDLIAKKIKDVPARFFATPEYLSKIGNPTTQDALKDAEFINIDSKFEFMEALNKRGLALEKHNFPILTENFLVMWELVKNGLGIGIADVRIGDAEPKVKCVLPNIAAFEFPIWLVAHRELNNSARIRLVFDLLAEALAK